MFRRLVSIVAVALLAAALRAESLPSGDEVLATLRMANDRFMRASPDPGADIVTDRARPSNIWTRATYFEGLMALHQIAPEQRYYDYAVRWGTSHAWSLAYGSVTDRNADDQVCGQTYLDLYAIDAKPERIRDIKTAIDAMVASTKSDDWWWIDALHMAMPLFARFGVMTGDNRYYARMYDLYSNTRNVQGAHGLYNPVEHLWWRDGDFDPPYREPNGANCYWSRGNGWVFAALVRVLDVLPADEAHRAEYVRTFQDMAAALKDVQRGDGFWNASLKDPTNYGGRELTGTAMFTYGMAWGIRKGLLPRAEYLPVVVKSWNAMAANAVRPDGSLGYIQGSGKQPSDGQPVTYDSTPNYDDFGTGAFLLAGAEVYKLTTERTVDAIALFRTQRSVQTDAGTVAAPASGAYSLDAEVTGTALGTIPDPALRIVGTATSRPLALDATAGMLRASTTAATPAAVATVAPDGAYSVALGATTAALSLTGGSAPAALVAAPRARVDGGNWSAGHVVVNAAQAITIVGEGIAADATLVRLELSGPGYRDNLALQPGAARSAALTIPSYALVAGSSYTGTITVERAATTALTGPPATPITTGTRSITTFELTVTAPTYSVERLANLSARATVGAGADLIVGFVVSAGGPKPVLIRGVGPTLSRYGVTSPLPNPVLRVSSADGSRAWQNDDWQSSSQLFAYAAEGALALQAGYSNITDATVASASVGAFPLTTRSRDAALVLVLPPGAYTAQIAAPADGSSGTVLAEVYELHTLQTAPRLTNLSARGRSSPADPLIAGFVVRGGAKRILLRAVGPTLATYGVPASSVLADPVLTVVGATGTVVGANDNWGSAATAADQVRFRTRVGAFTLPDGSKDAESVVLLDDGSYTAQAVGTTAGIALVEIYSEVPGT